MMVIIMKIKVPQFDELKPKEEPRERNNVQNFRDFDITDYYLPSGCFNDCYDLAQEICEDLDCRLKSMVMKDGVLSIELYPEDIPSEFKVTNFFNEIHFKLP